MEENSPIPARTFLWPELSEERVLVVGIGGGSDIVSAYALVRHLAPQKPDAFVYANTKTRSEPDWLYLAPHIARLPGDPSPREGLRITSGSTAIDRCMPRGAHGCPWIVWLRREEGEEEALSQEIQALAFTRLIAVDTGGDVLHRSRRGRDQRMLSVLRRTGLPGWLVVIAPGADGQSTTEKMRRDLERACQEKNFLGTFPLTGLLPTYRDFAPHLPPTRTPCLVLNAHESEEERMLIPRERRPEIPVSWLRAGFVFSLP